MFEIQLPRSMVVVFVALSSGLWLTTLLLVTGAVCGQREAGRLLSLHDLMAEATSINQTTVSSPCYVVSMLRMFPSNLFF